MLIRRNTSLWFTVATLLLGALAFPQAAVAQDTCEVPLFTKQNSGGANLMLLADNSLSMNAVIEHDDYDKDIRWTGDFDSDRTYYVAKDGKREPADFNSNWPKSPSADLVASDNGEDGWYTGNYMNWIYYHATDAQRLSVPNVTRIQVLKSVLVQIIDRSEQLRMGVAVYNGEKGGNLIGPIGKNHNALISIIEGITANTYTPTGEALESILDYFGDKTQSPITSDCQYNFILVVTDGLPTRDVDVSPYLHDADGDGKDPGNCDSIGAPYSNYLDCSDHMDDVAYWMAHRDVNTYRDGDQIVYTYTIGFAQDGAILKETAENGLGLYFEAKNAVELFTSIEYALQDILRRISAGSAVAVVSTEHGTDDRLFRGKFMPVDWDGYLECFALPHQEDDPYVWEAGDLLRTRSPGSRNIFTAVGKNLYKFEAGNAAHLAAEMGVADDAKAAELINWGRGSEVHGYRGRAGWLLGDIIHSTPVVVGAPSQYVMAESYESFRQAHENRTKMVYVGANDGMIHGFDAETGNEEWAFVPEFALPKFAAMADSFYCHTYSCDQTLTVKDALVNGAWKTVMVGGGGEGGSSIFALDITYSNKPLIMWQADLPNGKKGHSEVEVVSIAGRAVALVGSGLDVDDMEAYLYAYDLATGDYLGSTLLSSNSKADRNRASKPAVVDFDLDGQTDLVYVSDMLGSVYRIALGGSNNPSSWDVSELYEGSQEITADPVAAFGPGGSVFVYFGTGAYLEDPDMTSVGQNSFICVYDHHDGSTASMGNMANQTSSVEDIGGSKGWYVNLWNDDAERVTQKCVVVAETVIFSSFAPSSDPCVAGGYSWLYQMRYKDGGVPDVDYMSDEEDRSVSIGDGIASYPVVDLSAGNAIVQSSDATINVERIAGIIQPLRVRSWQENYDHVEKPTAVIIPQ